MTYEYIYGIMGGLEKSYKSLIMLLGKSDANDMMNI